jgi:ParB family chromosome partitioning protein
MVSCSEHPQVAMYLEANMTQLIQNEILSLSVDKILPNPNQPRKHFDLTLLDELADSIKTYGVLTPLHVRLIGDDLYELVSGERRLRAAQIAGLTHIPAMLVQVTDEDSAIIAIMENIQRENLTYMEEAQSYVQLMNYYHLTQEKIAKVLGKSQSFIANKIRLLKLDPEIIALLNEHGLSERHARALLRLPDPQLQKEVLEQVVNKDLNVKSTEGIIEKIRNSILVNNYEEPITPDKKARVKSFISAQIYINTIKTAFKAVKSSRKDATYQEVEKKDSIEIRISIPK